MINFSIDRYRQKINIETIEDKNIEIIDNEDEIIPEDENILLKALSILPPRYRAIFNLYAIEDFSHKEIAEKFNIAESTSRSNYLRAKKILSKKIAELQHHAR